jgi:hypothetical protein
MTGIPAARDQVKGMFEETGLRPDLVPMYTDALIALVHREAAERLREAGRREAAALIEPDPAVIDAVWGDGE